jgi:septal ring factor EnvC (AmiA/AmiB activator)
MLSVLHSDDPQAQPVRSRDEIEGAFKKSQQDTARLETDLDKSKQEVTRLQTELTTSKKEADRLKTELVKLETLNAQLNSEKRQQSVTETQVL